MLWDPIYDMIDLPTFTPKNQLYNYLHLPYMNIPFTYTKIHKYTMNTYGKTFPFRPTHYQAWLWSETRGVYPWFGFSGWMLLHAGLDARDWRKKNRWNGEGFGHAEVLSGNPKIGTTTTTTTTAATATTTTTKATLMLTSTVTTTSMIMFNVW